MGAGHGGELGKASSLFKTELVVSPLTTPPNCVRSSFPPAPSPAFLLTLGPQLHNVNLSTCGGQKIPIITFIREKVSKIMK